MDTLEKALMECAVKCFKNVDDAKSEESEFSKGIAAVKKMARCASHCLLHSPTHLALNSAAYARREFEDNEWKTSLNGPHPGVTYRRVPNEPWKYDISRCWKRAQLKNG